MTPSTASRLKRHEIRKALRSKRGAMAKLATELGIDKSLVSLTLKGNHGGRIGKEREAVILDAAEKRALELLEQEQRNA